MSIELKIVEMAEKIGAVAQQVDDLHGALYRNGFREDIKNLKNWKQDFELTREATCPAVRVIREESSKRRATKIRRTDVLIGIVGIVLLALETMSALGVLNG